MRLIDADAAIDMFQRLSYDDWNQGTGTTWANAFSEAADMIEDWPPADAVKVVRCEHCLAYDSFKNGIEGFCRKMGKVMCGSDFCSYAEWREDG